MKYYKKLLSLTLVTAFTAGFVTFGTISADAKAYSYRIKIALGNNQDAYFDESAVADLQSKYDAQVEDNQLVIKSLGYKSTVDIDVDDLIRIMPNHETNQTKYYVAGLKVSGSDAIITQATQDSEGKRNVAGSFTVTGDENYIVAYGVGEAIPYDVKYVDEDGNDLLVKDTYYAARGEIIYVPAKHVSGYYPDAYFRTASSGLKEDKVFTFKYKKYEGSKVITEDTEYETSTVYGEPVYEYQYSSNGSTVVNRGGNNANTANGTVGNGENANPQNNVTEDNTVTANNEDVSNTDEQGISDEEVPTDVIDIEEEEIAKSGQIVEPVVRNKYAGILIAVVSLIAVAVTGLVVLKKRNSIFGPKKDNKR